MRSTLPAYQFQTFPDRSKAPLPANRVAAQPWLVAGRLLFAPFSPRDGGPTDGEAEAIQAMGERLDRDRRASVLPDSVAFWFSPADGRTTPLTAGQAWLRVKVMQHVVVDMKLLLALGRVIPMTLLPPPAEPGYEARVVRRAAPAALKPTKRRPKASDADVSRGAAAMASREPVSQRGVLLQCTISEIAPRDRTNLDRGKR
jgi:hypothetical protein